jgi:hypothetical protein
MQKPSPIANKARKSIIERVQLRLSEIGFSIHDATTSWRMTSVKTDVFHFYLLRPAICRKWRVPLGSFQLFPMCFYPSLPSLSDAWERCEASTPLPYPVPPIRAQLRWQVFKGIFQSGCQQETVYGLADEPGIVDRIASDIEIVIDRKLMPFWSRFNEPSELLRTFRVAEDVNGREQEGPVDIGAKESHIRLFYFGFTALWLEDYELALSVLTRCRAHAKWRPLDIPDGFDTRPVLDCIDRGLAQARMGASRGLNC